MWFVIVSHILSAMFLAVLVKFKRLAYLMTFSFPLFYCYYDNRSLRKAVMEDSLVRLVKP